MATGCTTDIPRTQRPMCQSIVVQSTVGGPSLSSNPCRKVSSRGRVLRDVHSPSATLIYVVHGVSGLLELLVVRESQSGDAGTNERTRDQGHRSATLPRPETVACVKVVILLVAIPCGSGGGGGVLQVGRVRTLLYDVRNG